MAKVQQGNNGNFVYIPRLIIKLKGWAKGTELIFSTDNRGDVIVREVTSK